jgi:hypothetical protein
VENEQGLKLLYLLIFNPVENERGLKNYSLRGAGAAAISDWRTMILIM